MKELLPAYGGQMECGGEHEIEIEDGEWWDQEILLVQSSEVHRLDSLQLHKQGAGQDRRDQESERQGREVLLQRATRSRRHIRRRRRRQWPFGDEEFFHNVSANDVLLNDPFQDGRVAMPVPCSVGIDDGHRTTGANA